MESAPATAPTTASAPAPVPATTTAAAAPTSQASQYASHLKNADSLAKRGDFGRSVRAYRAALGIDKDGVAAHLGLGNAYYELDTLDEALVHLERARALAPDDDQAYVLLGAAYQSAGRSADAITAYERYLALAPDGKFARDVRSILKRLKR